MIKLLWVNIRNFMAFGNQVTRIDLSREMSTLILGENLDAPGSRNGAGKTTIFNAVCYALFNQAFDKISLNKLINATNTSKKAQMEVTLAFEKNGNTYEITRRRGAVTDIKVICDGTDITKDSIAANDEFIQSIIGKSYELFCCTDIFSGYSIPFLDLPIAQQRALIEELFNITALTQKAEKLKELIKDTEGKTNIELAIIKEQQKQFDTYQQQLTEAKTRVDKWNKANADNLHTAVAQLQQLSSVNFEEEKQLHEAFKNVSAEISTRREALNVIKNQKELLVKDRDALNSQLQLIGKTKQQGETNRRAQVVLVKQNITAVETEIKNVKTQHDREVATVTKSGKDAERRIEKLKKDLAHLQDEKCPYCLQQYASDGGKIDTLVAEIEAGQQIIDGVPGKILDLEGIHALLVVACNVKTAEFNDKLSELESIVIDSSVTPEEQALILGVEAIGQDIEAVEIKIGEENEVLRQLAVDQSDLAKLTTFGTIEKVYEAEREITALNTKILSLQAETNPHVEALGSLIEGEVVAPSYSNVDENKKDIEHQKFLLKLLTDKNSFIRKKIINKTIPFLNRQLSHYTRLTGMPHLVKFDDDMTCTITELNRELDFGNLSGGEKKRVNVALAMAFRDVFHHLHDKFSTMFIDEIDGSLDADGVERIFKMFKMKTRDDRISLWLISHRPEAIGRFDRTITVQKQNGFSSIIEP